MNDAALDNPVWAALHGRHAHCAIGDATALRYPADMAPFVGVRTGCATVADATLDALVARDERVYLLGHAPAVSDAWSLHAYAPLAQMACGEPLAAVDGPPIVPLDASRRADVLALTGLVYPHYFRPRTMAMGRYFGIYDGERLAAMIGERMATDTCQEISAVCTHPDFTGRGLARRLLAWLTNDLLRQGRLPFLHVSHENLRAKRMYETIGYRTRRDIGFWSLRRA